MNFSRISHARKRAAGIIAFLILAAIVTGAFYISAESAHDCIGGNCPICDCIQQCENTLRNISDGAAIRTLIAILAILLLVQGVCPVYDRLSETLVSRKIRLND